MFSLSSDTITSLDRIRLHLMDFHSIPSLVCFAVVSIGRTHILNGKKVFAVQNTTYYSRKCDIMVRSCEMKVEQPKEVEGPICSFLTSFAAFANSTPA